LLTVPAEEVEGQCPDRPLSCLGIGLWRQALTEVRAQQGEHLDIGVEEPVHGREVRAGVSRPHQVRVSVVAVMAVSEVGVGDVAGRLLEVGGEAAPFDRFGEGLADLLAG
jgi:hypothetical protein